MADLAGIALGDRITPMPRLTRTCPECGEVFVTEHPRKLFCKAACSKAYANRELVRGQSMVGLAKAWRAGRGRGKAADREAARVAGVELMRMIRRFIDEDKAQGRGDPVELFRARSVRGLLD